MVETFAVDCTTPKTVFTVGETVCVKASGVPVGGFFPRHLIWAAPNSTIVRSTDITTDPQTDLLVMSATFVVGTTTVDSRGAWEVTVQNPFFFYPEAAARFTVVNPVLPTADISVDSTFASSSVQAGGQAIFGLQVSNYGPDSSNNVTLTDAVPANTTFASFVQLSGPAFTCNNPESGGGGTSTCTIASLPSGASATFAGTYDVSTGASVGTVITNTADIASVTDQTPATPDQNDRNNSTTNSTTVTATSGGGGCTITCPGSVTTPADTTENGQPGAIVHFDSPSSEGSCGSITTNHCDDCFFPVGTTVVSATSETGGGQCSFTVTVTEGGAPTITCPPDKTADANSNCEATVDAGTPTTTGDSVTVTSSRSDGRPLSDPYPAGTTSITWTATNSSGTASCHQSITVNDTTAPTITCPANITTANDAGQCSATVNPGTATATDNCGTPTVTGTRSDAQALDAPYPQGTTTITWTATDDSNNTASCTQTVTVNDTENPTITCPANITTGNDAGQCSATVDPGTATATDNCGAPTVTGTRSDGQALNAPYPKGTTTITWTATDGSGNHSSCTQTVTVNDTEAPVVTCPANVTRSTDPGTCSATFNPGTAETTDNCDSNPTVTGVRSDGQPLNAPYPKGTTVVTWTATDSSGNTSTPCAQTITVNDTEAPVISCPANITHGTDPGTCSAVINPGTATATDNCDNPTITGTRSDNQPLNAPYPRGTTTITWTARDSSNNSSSCTQTITVNDTEAPAISCPANITRSNDPGMCSANINPGTATATDNCDTPTVTGARSDGGPLNGSYPVGTTTITWTATDGSCNRSSCTQTITVNDTENPTISCPSSQTLEPTCPSGAVGNWTEPVGTDNCPGATTTRTGPAPGTVFAAGTTTTITYTVNDAHGHSASCSFTITVKTVNQTIEGLKTSVNNSSLSPTNKGGLLAKLQAAQDALASGHTNTACAKLADFINSTQNLINHGDISAAQGNAWISTATHLRNAIGCTNNPCS